MEKKEYKNIVIYQTKDGAIEFRGDFDRENIWATQAQIAAVFGVERSVVTKHIRNIFKENELLEKVVCAKFAHTTPHGAIPGKTQTKEVIFYNLDVILCVGYRTNSKTAIEFRKWATKTLREHIVKGYTINRKQIAKNYDAFMKAVGDIQTLLPEHVTLDPKAVIDLIKEFSSTWMSLDAYDKGALTPVGSSKRAIQLSAEELLHGISDLRAELLQKGEATEVFARERAQGSVEGIVGNIMQAFGGKHVYETVEEKAAHLLYFMVKNHPFTDGNKRSGAFAFIWFLRKIKVKGARNINPSALTALTLLIAESEPKKKEQMAALVTQMLR